jgi:hypothetical protein
LIAATFVLPVYFLQDLVTWLANSQVIFFLFTPIIWVGSYFASFVIAGEVSDVCLGGTASFSKAMYKTSIKGVGRLLGTDMLVLLGILSALMIGVIISVVFSWGKLGILADLGIYAILLCIAGWLFLFTLKS